MKRIAKVGEVHTVPSRAGQLRGGSVCTPGFLPCNDAAAAVKMFGRLVRQGVLVCPVDEKELTALEADYTRLVIGKMDIEAIDNEIEAADREATEAEAADKEDKAFTVSGDDKDSIATVKSDAGTGAEAGKPVLDKPDEVEADKTDADKTGADETKAEQDEHKTNKTEADKDEHKAEINTAASLAPRGMSHRSRRGNK